MREASGGGVDYAIEATGRPEAMLAAFLSTRARGAAVLIGIPREDAVLPLPALTIPRMERRVLGSIYGSSRPERDFPQMLELYSPRRLPLDRLVSHRLPLDEVGRAFELLRSGEALRVVLDLAQAAKETHGPGRPGRTDRRGVGRRQAERQPRQRGARPAREPDRGGGDRMLAHPSPGHTPVLVCVGPEESAYEPVWPPTLMMNKATALEDAHQTMTWGAAQLGIGQGVLDAVADGLLEASRRPARARRGLGRPGRGRRDRRPRSRTARRCARRSATCVSGRDPEAAARLVAARATRVTNPFYGGE